MGNVITAGRLQCNERGDVNIKDDTVTVTVVYIRERVDNNHSQVAARSCHA